MTLKLPKPDWSNSTTDLPPDDFDHIDKIARTLAEELINLYSASSWRLSMLDISNAPLRIARLAVSHLEDYYQRETPSQAIRESFDHSATS